MGGGQGPVPYVIEEMRALEAVATTNVVVTLGSDYELKRLRDLQVKVAVCQAEWQRMHENYKDVMAPYTNLLFKGQLKNFTHLLAAINKAIKLREGSKNET